MQEREDYERECYEMLNNAITLARRIGDKNIEAVALCDLGTLYGANTKGLEVRTCRFVSWYMCIYTCAEEVVERL